MRRGRTNIILLAFSLILAAGMWLVHILSQSYYAYLPFNIRAVTDVQGYAPKSVSARTVFLGGKASGFFILGYNLSGKVPKDIDVEISSESLEQDSDIPEMFSVRTSQISDRISESVNSFFEATFIPEVLLEFTFEPRTFRKVPVTAHISASCAPQFMQISEIRCEPDSVTVYGNESDLEQIFSVNTKGLYLNGLDRASSGVISLEKARNLRIVPEAVTYTVPVARYVEYTYDVDLTASNVPAGKQLILLPSRVEVSCRLPFGTDVELFRESTSFTVDFDDVAASRSLKVKPRPGDDGIEIYSYSFNPPFVDCIISESVR